MRVAKAHQTFAKEDFAATGEQQAYIRAYAKMLEKLDDFFVRIVGLIQSVDNDEYRGRQIIQESVELTVKCIQGRLRVPVHVVFVKAEERGQALGAKVSELAEQRRQQSAQVTRSGGVRCIEEVVED